MKKNEARKICVVTGARADYGLLYWVMKEIQAAPDLQLQIIATGMHLSPEFGLTYRVIEQDGFTIDARVEMLLSGDTPGAIAKSMGLATIGFSDAFDRLKPDLIVLLGDRFELLAAAQTALVSRIPIAHIAGGDTTEGAFDEAIRHSISKMSHLHFATNLPAVRRLRQLGENPQTVFHVGSPGLDHIQRTPLLSRDEFQDRLGFSLKPKNFLITFHPVTLESATSGRQFCELLNALHQMGPETGLIFTRTNSDTDGRIINQLLDGFLKEHPNARAYTSLGQLLYLSALRHVDLVVGNSSSGLYEAPSFKTPTVNIGDRQRGRLQADSVLNCEPLESEILSTLHRALELNCSATVNPYGDGASSARIVSKMREIPDFSALLKKHFFDLKE